MKIKAAVLRDQGEPVSIETLELDPPKANEVLIKNINCGWCHSDQSIVKGDMSFPIPVALGHEAAGIVEAIGPGVTSVEVGDHVVATWMVPCGSCKECLSGRGFICSGNFPYLGSCTMLDGTTRLTDMDGEPVHTGFFVSGFSTHSVIPERGAVKINKEVPFEQACLLGCCVPTGHGAVTNVAQVNQSHSVAVWGMGGIGLNVIRGLALRGAYPIIAVDCEGSKEAIAREFGATHFIDSSKEDPVPRIDYISPKGVDFVFEASGTKGGYEQSFWTMTFGASLIAIGVPPESEGVNVPMFLLPLHAKSIKGAIYGNIQQGLDIPRLANMALSGELKLDKLITKRFKLEEINDVIAAMDRREIIGRWVCDLEE
jgi:Zn-dependent alcohol dehydrogenase